MNKEHVVPVMLVAVIFYLVAGCGEDRKTADAPSHHRTGGATMDEAKKKALLDFVSSQPEPKVVSIDRFFDGNTDLGSIGCNLIDHPWIDRFREILTDLLNRDDVEAVFAQISELNPGKGCWPFADTVLVVGTISSDKLRELVSPFHPDEIGTGKEYGASLSFLEKYRSPVHAVWWD